MFSPTTARYRTREFPEESHEGVALGHIPFRTRQPSWVPSWFGTHSGVNPVPPELIGGTSTRPVKLGTGTRGPDPMVS